MVNDLNINKVETIPELAVVQPQKTEGSNVVQMPVSTVLKPETVVTDVERNSELYAHETAIKSRFPNGKIEAPKLIAGMQKIKNKLFWDGIKNFDLHKLKLWKHSVNLSPELTKNDYEQITEFVNLHKGKYADTWLFGKIENINNLAMFLRSIRRIDKLNYFKSLSPEQWEICMDGIINKPDKALDSLLRYKYDSTDINKYCSGMKSTKEAENDTRLIEDFLNTKKLKYDMKVYRGEGSYKLLNGQIINPFTKESLGQLMEKFADEIDNGKHSEEEIKDFVERNVLAQKITQNRFMSTAMDIKSTESYAKKVLWKIDVPKGTKASMIESYNVERDSETEVLIQRDSLLKITDAYYDKANHRWELNAELLQ